jgi:CHAT domain-containing protein
MRKPGSASRLVLVAVVLAAVAGGIYYYSVQSIKQPPPPDKLPPIVLKNRLDPSSWKLTDLYVNERIVGDFPYVQTPYPESFKTDGVGGLDTKPFLMIYADNPEPYPFIVEHLKQYYPALEKNPKDLKALQEIVQFFASIREISRNVPFMDRYLAAGGKMTLSLYASYIPALIRAKRFDDALKHYEEACRRYGVMTRSIAACMVFDKFHYHWMIERDFKAMMETFRAGMETDVSQSQLHNLRRILFETLRRAGDDGELGWFLPRMKEVWHFFPPPHLEEVRSLLKECSLEAPPALVRAINPLCGGLDLHPNVLHLRCLDLLDAGDSDAALKAAERMVAITKDKPDRVPHLEARMLLLRVHLHRGDLDQAFALAGEIESQAKELDRPALVGLSLMSSGSLYEHVADFRKTIECYGRAYQIAEEQDYEELTDAARTALGRALVNAGMAKEIEPKLRQEALLTQRCRILDRLPGAFEVWGASLRSLGRHAEAVKAYRTVDEMLKQLGPSYNPEISTRIEIQLGLGQALLALQDADGAEAAFRKAAEFSRRSQKPSAWWKWQSGLARTARARGDRDGARKEIAACLENIEAQRASLKDFQHRRTLNDNKYSVYQLAVQLALEEGRSAEAFGIAERSRARAFLDELGTQARGTLGAERVDLDALGRECPDVAVVAYYVLPECIACWVVSGGKASLVVLEVSEQELRKRVVHFRSAISSDLQRMSALQLVLFGRPPDEKACARALYDAVWKPVAEKLEPGARVCIIPHQILHYVPFQALHDGERFLIERNELFYAPSASALVAIRHRKIARADGVAIFDPLVSPDPKSPFHITESKTIHEMIPGSTFIQSKKATIKAFTDAAPGAGIIHVSCHGTFNPWIPLHSGLIFAPEMLVPHPVLRAQDVYAMTFDRTGLIVMSACVSSVGDMAGGDEVTGITRAFQLAGINDVIGSLWPVDNRTTTKLMIGFYRELKKDPDDPIAALTRAQRGFLKETPTISAWGAFECTGDGKRGGK